MSHSSNKIAALIEIEKGQKSVKELNAIFDNQKVLNPLHSYLLIQSFISTSDGQQYYKLTFKGTRFLTSISYMVDLLTD